MKEIADFLARAWQANLNDPSFILAGLFFALAGILVAVMDRLEHEVAFDTSVFRKWRRTFWLKSESWVNKYKRYPTGKLVVKEYDKNNRPVYAPRFWGSTTFFVWLLDGWHLAKSLKNTMISLGAMSLTDVGFDDWRFWAGVILLKTVISSFFELFYESIFRAR